MSYATEQALEKVPCPLCGSWNQEEIWSHQTGVTNGICLNCGHIHLTRQISEDALQSSYEEYRQSYPETYLKDEANPLFAIARSRHSFLEQHLLQPPRSILEIGCGYGHFLILTPRECFRAGIEPSYEQAGFARANFGLAGIWQGPYEKLVEIPPDWPQDGFDLICCFHVLEHVKDPGMLLRFAHRLLTPGGYLCLAVPDIHTLSPDLIELFFLARNWHLHTFYPQSLAWFLQRNGFEILKIMAEEPIPMLRSSFITLARAITSPATEPISRPESDDARQALVSFHETLKARLRKVVEAFTRWFSLEKKVAIYGGGIHTQALLELTGVSPDQVKMIIDDDPVKQGKTLQGIVIYHYQEALAQGVDVIVVSSLASEHLILAHLQDAAPEDLEVVGIYRDLMEAPSWV